jgi:RsiW-degrading membrane proteinase PrsW (M82 family)
MNSMENIYVCLVAPFILAILCLKGEGRKGLLFLLAGMTSCLLSGYVSAFAAGLAGTDLLTSSHEIAPVVEEVMKSLPLLFYILIYEPDKKSVISGTLRVAVGFATFENVCFLTSYGTSDLLRLMIRGFGTGAMHVVCGMIVAVGLFFIWDRTWLRAVGSFALLGFVTTFHAIFNVFVNQTGAVFWIGSAIPVTMMLTYLLFFRRKTDLA